MSRPEHANECNQTHCLTNSCLSCCPRQFHWEDFCSCQELSLFFHSQTTSLPAPRLIVPVTTGITPPTSVSSVTHQVTQISLWWDSKVPSFLLFYTHSYSKTGNDKIVYYAYAMSLLLMGHLGKNDRNEWLDRGLLKLYRKQKF